MGEPAPIPPPSELGPIMYAAIERAIRAVPQGSSVSVIVGALRRQATRDGASLVLRVICDDEPQVREAVEAVLATPAAEVYPLALLNGARDPAVTVQEVGWAELAEGLTRCRKVRGSKLDAPAWMPVEMAPDMPLTRKADHVEAVWALVCDLDDGAVLRRIEAMLEALGLRAVLHTTWSHSADKHKARVIFPFAQKCPARRWARVWAAGARWAAARGMVVDEQCKDASRLYFLPALPADDSKRRALFVGRVFEGDRLDWRQVLREHPEPPEPVAPRRRRTRMGYDERQLDDEGRRRRRFAEGLVRHRCKGIVAHGVGGRNARCFAAARCVAQLAMVGALDEEWGAAEIEAAGIEAGLSHKEASKAVSQGLEYGRRDGPWQWQ